MTKLNNLYFLLLSLLLIVSCKGGSKSALESFGVKVSPDINIDLLSITPSNKFLFVGESVQLNASGGEEPYIFSLDSGSGAITSAGLFTASSIQSSAVIKVTDKNLKEAFATISVSVKISISPQSKILGTGDTVTFNAAGGLPPYKYRIVTGAGSVNENSGFFTASGSSAGSSVIEVKDSSQNTAYAAITINPAISLTPQNLSVGFSEQINFSTTGGDRPYVYSILTGQGSISSSTGTFIAPTASGSTVVRVTDSSNNTMDSVVTIIDKPQIQKPQAQVSLNKKVTFTTTNGTPPYQYSIISGTGSINSSTGEFTAPSVTGTVIIQVKDLNNYTSSVDINVFRPGYVAAGVYHTCFTGFKSTNKSTSSCWGLVGQREDNAGQLGPIKNWLIADQTDELGDNLTYLDLGTNTQVKDVVVGRYSTCVVLTDNSLKCFGYNNYGNLGLGNRTYTGYAFDQIGNQLSSVNLGTGLTLHPTLKVEDALNINNHTTCAILSDNSMKCWGINSYGKLGIGSTQTIGDGATEVGDAIKKVDFGADIPIKVSVGASHVCTLLNNNTVKCWGRSNYGQTGYESNATKGHNPATIPANNPSIKLGTSRTAKDICSGTSHSCAITDTNNIKCWGRNSYGELGQEIVTQNIGLSSNQMGDNLPNVDLGFGRTAKALTCQAYSTCAILDNNKVKCWGHNGYGNLGIGSTTNKGRLISDMGDALPYVNLGVGRTAIKLKSGQFQTCANLDDGSHKCWGRNRYGQLAQGHRFDIGKSSLSLGENLSKINLGSSQTVDSLHVNESSGCAKLSNNKVKCWGLNFFGTRGSGDSIIGDQLSEMGTNLLSLPLPDNTSFKEIKSYTYTTCGLTTDNRLACWGYNGYGASAIGSTRNQGPLEEHWKSNFKFIDFGQSRTVKNFSIGNYGGCAILSDDKVACWGRNDVGQLAIGNKNSRGSSLTHLGENFIMSDLGNTAKPLQISSGESFNCARFDNGKIKCWGLNDYGQLGLGSTNPMGDSTLEIGNNLPYLDLGSSLNSSHVCNGLRYACSLFTNGKVKCWGQRNYIGSPNADHRGNQTADMGDNLPFLNFGSSLKVNSISCGRTHACALFENDKAKCWGEGSYGQLGQGSTATLGDSLDELAQNLPYIDIGSGRSIVKIYAGYYRTCAILDNSQLKCWGRNDYSQLGLGHRTHIGTLNVTLGDNLPKIEVKK